MANIDVNQITAEIGKQQAKWIAGPNALLQLSDSELQARLGVKVDQADLQRISQAPQPDIAWVIAHFETLAKQQPGTPGPGAMTAAPETLATAPPTTAVDNVRQRLDALNAQRLNQDILHFPWWLFTVDWRNRKGRNNVTAVTDQGGCGSCVSFGSTAALESMVLVEHNVTTDLSEAELLFCGGGSCGGWWPSSAINYISSSGVSQEGCFPYQAHDMPCTTCAERVGEAIQVTNNVTISDVPARKQYLANVGPMIAVFAVYNDFFGYRSGVYSHVTGGLAGYHCVEVIGYDDWAGAWICKNSWGTGWGDSGFFKIAYGQCDIDGQFPFWGVYGTRWYHP